MDVLRYIKNHKLIIILLILLGVYLFMHFYYKELLDNVSATPAAPANTSAPAPPAPVTSAAPAVVSNGSLAQGLAPNSSAQGLAPNSSAQVPTSNDQAKQIDAIVAGQTQLTTTDLLPNYDQANQFTQENPVSKMLQEQNFLQAGYHMGINTISSSNKIAYLDLRSAPPIPKQQVGPFLNSSYEEPAGAKRKFFEMI